MSNPPLFTKKLIETYRKHTSEMAKLYYRKLLKASMLISIVPIIVIAILVVYEKLTLLEGLSIVGGVIFGSIFFAKPYMDDLHSLNTYVDHLALDLSPETPPLSFLGNVNELSDSVNNLHKSWEERRSKIEAALAESRILFDTIPDILMMVDSELNIVRANNAAISVFGKQLVHKKITDITPDANLIDSINKSISDGAEQKLEISSKAGNVTLDYLVMIEKFPASSMGNVSAVIIMHDITESKLHKQMLKDFVANASHEIRTPLTSVMGFLENIQDMEHDDDENTKKHRQTFISIMHDQTERMSKLVEDLLSLSKVEMSEKTVPEGIVDINKIISSTKNRLKFLAEEKNIKVAFSKTNNLPQVKGDASELMQVFTNILSNAIKYSPANTQVTIKTTLEHRAETQEDLIVTEIKDDGEGIDKKHLPRITERFYRVDKMRSRKIGGTGLGLAITKHIINRHRGELKIESTIGEGSVFTVYLSC